MLSNILTVLLLIPLFALIGVYAERKFAGYVQNRLGPSHTGPYGLLQTLADVLKLLQKEDLRPAQADKWMFALGPILVFVPVFLGFLILPLWPSFRPSSLPTALALLLSILSLDVLGVAVSGLGSGNKFALLGAQRAMAQMISYEIPFGLSLLGSGFIAGSLNLSTIALTQKGEVATSLWGLVDIPSGSGFLHQLLFQHPLVLPFALLYFISGLALANRGPFDLSEAESELVAGFHTEYSGFRWALLMLSEYGLLLLTALLFVCIFAGAGYSPLPNIGAFHLQDWTQPMEGLTLIWYPLWLIIKCIPVIFAQFWIRWTLPRVRIDQLMKFCYYVLIPFGLVLFIAVAIGKTL